MRSRNDFRSSPSFPGDRGGRFNRISPLWLIGGLIVVVLLAAILVMNLATRGSDTFTINKMERVEDRGGNGAKYLIFTDKGVFKNTDNILFFKFNSSDLYNQLETGKTYTCETNGVRFAPFSWYKNLLSCEEQS